jgi:hypothetical protein
MEITKSDSNLSSDEYLSQFTNKSMIGVGSGGSRVYKAFNDKDNKVRLYFNE